MSLPTGLLGRLIPMRDKEARPVLLGTTYAFLILTAHYMLRPVRDEISAADRGNVQLLWTAVFLVMLVAVPLYSFAVARLSRAVFIPLANRFFALNLLLFFVALYALPAAARPWIDRAFYVWQSVFALFVVTVFWGFIADLFRNEQSKRLFGLIAMGASVGGIAGSFITALLAEHVPVFALLLLAIIPLEIASQIAQWLHRLSARHPETLRQETQQRIGGTAWAGYRTVFQSPYLRKIALYLGLLTFASTVLYFQQAHLLGEAIADRAERTAFLAKIDLAVNVITITTQGLVTAHIIRKWGLAIALAMIPAVVMLGFVSLGVYPLLATLVVAQVIYRAGRYAIAKPAREVLFTVVPREDRYKAKSFIDAAVYRGGDLASGWIYAGLAALGLTVGSIALVAAPVAAVWVGMGILLGRDEARERERVGDDDMHLPPVQEAQRE
jgi:AAA family ATP:ADP antiporter